MVALIKAEAIVMMPYIPRAGRDYLSFTIRGHVTHHARHACRIMILAAEQLAGLYGLRTRNSWPSQPVETFTLEPPSAKGYSCRFVCSSGMAGPRLCQLLERLDPNKVQVKLVYLVPSTNQH